MTEKYMFADSDAGVTLMMRVTLSLRSQGFRTRTGTMKVAGFTLHVLSATAAPKASRRARGL